MWKTLGVFRLSCVAFCVGDLRAGSDIAKRTKASGGFPIFPSASTEGCLKSAADNFRVALFPAAQVRRTG
jgi:hypothetical protein